MDWRAFWIEAAKLLLAFALVAATVGISLWRIRQ